MQIGMESKDSLTAHGGSTKEGVKPCPRTGREQFVNEQLSSRQKCGR